MLKLIHGEIYRLLHKKSVYIYFCSLAVGYFLLAFIRSGGFREGSILNDAMNFFFFLPALAGGFLFSAIYTDDLTSKNLTMLVGFGINKAKIAAAKYILMLFSCIVVFGLAPVFHFAVYAALGCTAAGALTAVYMLSLKYLLMSLAFAALSGVAVYGLQRVTFSIVLYILFAFNIIGGLLATAITPFAPNFAAHLISGVTDRIILGGQVAPVIEYTLYTAIALILSVAAFYKKEMEF